MAQPSTGGIEAAGSMLQLVTAYDQFMIATVQEHNLSLGGLGTWVEDFHAQGLNLSTFLDQRQQLLGDTLSATTGRVNLAVDTVPRVLDDMRDFSLTDRKVFQETQSFLNIDTSKRQTSKASSPEAIRAMMAALDQRVWKGAQSYLNVDSAQRFASHGSSPEAIRALRAALDQKVWQGAQSYLNVDSAQRFTSKASSTEAVRAMLANLDRKVLQEATSFMGQEAMRRAASKASSIEANRVIEQALGQNRKQPPNSGRRTQGQQRPHSGYPPPPPRPPRQEAPKPQADQYEEVMNGLRRGDMEQQRIAKGLTTFDRAAVLKVIRTVEARRAKFPDEKDREIAVLFIKRTNNQATAEPAHIESTQIVLTLLGDKGLKGSFPF